MSIENEAVRTAAMPLSCYESLDRIADPDAVVPLPTAAVIYDQDQEDRTLLLRFAMGVRAKGWRVGGLAQALAFDNHGNKIGLDSIDLENGSRIPLARPTKSDRQNRVCSLDHGALAASTDAIRRAVANRTDIIIIEKFGKQELKGKGLFDDIMQAMASNIPTLVSVPVAYLDDWNAATGMLAGRLPADPTVLWRWWEENRAR